MLFETIGVLGHNSIRNRIKSLKDIKIEMSAEEILQMAPCDRPRQLKEMRRLGYILIDPPLTEAELDVKGTGLLGTVSLDLELGNTICLNSNPHAHPVKRGDHLEDLIVDLRNPETLKQIEEFDCKMVLNPDESFVFVPGELVRSFTRRYIFMPYDIMGWVIGRSKMGRLGISSTVDAPKIDPGFSGRIVLELAHHGVRRFALYEGLSIAQIVFFSVEGRIDICYDELNDPYARNEDIHYAMAPLSLRERKVIRRIGVKPIGED